MGLIVDTNFLIRAERDRNADWHRGLPIEEESAISAITLSEITAGFHLAANTNIAARRKAFIDDAVQKLRVVAFDADIARVHAQIWASQRRKGKMIGAHDIIIAATAISLGWGVLTFNADEFGQIDGLSVRVPS